MADAAEHAAYLAWIVGINGPYDDAPVLGAAGAGRDSSGAISASRASRLPHSHGLKPGTEATVEPWRGFVARYFPPSDVDLALCVISYESGGNPDAANPKSSARGLFQHLARYWPERSVDAGWGGVGILDPEANVAVAAWLVYDAQGGGWQHWTTISRCR